jgi:accessory gene regulator protein AgrB
MVIDLLTSVSPYGSLINLALLFVDGLLFGLAAKKAITSVIILVIALVLAGYLGLSIPFLTPGSIVTHAATLLGSIYSAVGPIFFAFPIAFIAGFAIAFWKG